MSTTISENPKKDDKDDKDEEIIQNEIIMELELGDVIKIFNPLDDNLNEKTFIIDYIDSSKMRLIDVDNLNSIQLKIDDDGIIGDGSINKISLLSRSETPGYAKQNNLLPSKWINIYFGGDIPTILTGEITNLEEDMIEIKTYPDEDIIYINFDYKGLPEDLPIENIEIREPPEITTKLEKEIIEEGEIELPELGEEKEKIDIEKLKIKVPIEEVKAQFREFIIKADQIKFGYEELGPIVQYVDVTSSQQRYSLEEQLSDLLNDLLSTIPNAQRTNRVLNNIHTMIDRFKQLRENFSDFDEYGNVNSFLTYEADYKPLLNYFLSFNINLYWILPVVKNIKKIYNVDNISELNENNQLNIEMETTINDIQNIVQLQESYKSNQLTNDENKYVSLYKQLEPYMTPFLNLNDENTQDIIYEKEVNTNINTILNNLDELYSTVIANNNLAKRRFIIQKYNLGLSSLSASDFTGQKMTAVRVKLTNSDLLALNSIVTLPEPTIRFSRINLPGSNILDKASLNEHFINYWQLLRKSTRVKSIIIDNFEQDIQYDENNFVNNIKNYILDTSSDTFKDIPKVKLYKEFINHIVPKTRILFNLMKKYITGKLSLVEVVSYLEPFLIYSDNLTYMQYKDIISFIYQKISEYNKNYIDRAKIFAQLKRLPNERHSNTNIFNILKLLDDNKIKVEITDLYNLTDIEYVKGNLYTNSEILNKITKEDCGKLYNSGLSKEAIPLMFPNEFSSLLNREKINRNEIIEKEKTKKTCKDIIIAKHYNNETELLNDNEIDVYFDKKYDLTNYGILDKYEKEMLSMTPENFLVFLIDKIKSDYKLSDEDADYLADTLINGHKRVIDGQYAVLYLGIQSEEPYNYYLRKNNIWELDETIEKNTSTDDNNLLCNLQDKCISVAEKNIEDKCESYELSDKKIQNKILENIISEFDNKYKLSREEIQKKIEEEFNYNVSIMPLLIYNKNYQLLKYNNYKYELGIKAEEMETQVVQSPYIKLRDLILSQQDFVKKQNDIVKFKNYFTRDPYEGYGPSGEEESPYWLYCIKTNTQLLPIFKYEIAMVFIHVPEEYSNELDKLIKKVGKLSDDGNYWVDVHSGWPIDKIDYDVEEGYEEGFKISTRSVLEEDIGNKLITEKIQAIKYNSPELKMINNIINAISVFMGINIESQKEFMMNITTEAIRKLMPNEDIYKKYVKDMANKNKTVPSYEDLYYTTLLYNTLGSVLLGIQTSIPSISTRRTFPGCVKSFVGYPFDGSGDYTSLNYLACVAFQIKSKDKPWYVLKGKSQEYIFNKIKLAIDGTEKTEGLLSQQEIKRKIEEKTEYMLLNPESEIPKEHDIQNWLQFLPPLNPFKLKGLINISSEFKSSLLSNLKSGSPDQREKILMVESKIIQFSLAIQEAIQNVINKKKLILTNVKNEPYIENSCCNDKNKLTTIGYFEKENSHISEYNQIVNNLNEILNDITLYTKSPIFQTLINTKNIYPPIGLDHSDDTIYLSFIKFCHFRSLIPINEDLLPLCTDKPTLFQNDSISEVIAKLKNEGRNYTKESFLRLLQIVNRNNIIHLNLESSKLSCVTLLSKILEQIDNENDDVVEGSLRELIISSLDTFDIASPEGKITKETKDLNNFLIRNIDNMKDEIIDFTNKYVDTKTSKKIVKNFNNFISTFENWNILETNDELTVNKISNDSLYKINNFMKTVIDYVVNVFPNIILNKVDYKNLQIPSYWKLSLNHNNDIKKYISDFYENLRIFYDNKIIYNILINIQKKCKNIVNLSNIFPSFTSIKIDNDKEIKAIFDERTSRLLFEYLFLRVFVEYINLTDDNNMIVREIEKEQNVEDIFSTEYLDNVNKRIDVEYESSKEIDFKLLGGDKKKLRQNISSLLMRFIQIISNEKDVIDVSYQEIQDRVFKLREKEKNLVTDRLKFMTDEERDADTVLKINKLGPIYSKGLQKSLIEYDRDAFEEDKEFRDKINNYERMLSKKTGLAGDDLEELLNEFMEEEFISEEIDKEVYDMSYMDEDYYDGHVDGYSAPDVEEQEYYDS